MLRVLSDLQKVFSDDRQGNDQVRERKREGCVVKRILPESQRLDGESVLHFKKSHG